MRTQKKGEALLPRRAVKRIGTVAAIQDLSGVLLVEHDRDPLGEQFARHLFTLRAPKRPDNPGPGGPNEPRQRLLRPPRPCFFRASGQNSRSGAGKRPDRPADEKVNTLLVKCSLHHSQTALAAARTGPPPLGLAGSIRQASCSEGMGPPGWISSMMFPKGSRQ